MKVYLCDHLFTQRKPSAWSNSLRKVLGSVFLAEATLGVSSPPSRHPAYGESDAILFVHSNGCEEEWRAKAAEPSTKCHIILVRSAGGQGDEQGGNANIHGCFWSPGAFAACNDEGGQKEIKSFIDQIKCQAPLEWKLLRPPNTESLFALRLLCDAWMLTKGKECEKIGNVLVHAPVTLEDWLDLFKKTETDSRPATEDVVAMMGDKQQAAKELLDAVASGGNQISVAINKFLEISAP